MASKIPDQKAALIAELNKALEGAKTKEQKFEILLGALDTAESYVTHARGILNDELQNVPEKQIFEVGGYPYKRSQVRGSGIDGAPARYTLRSMMTADLKAAYSFAKKA